MERQAFLHTCQRFEEEIELYTGTDPLQCRYNYLTWLEKNRGIENVMPICKELLEQTLNRFTSDPKYIQDVRLVELILLYISMQTDGKLIVFTKTYEGNIGTQCSILFDAWSKELVKYRDFDKAIDVLKKGFEKNAQPLEVLQNAHKNLLYEIGLLVVSGQYDCSLVDEKMKCKCCQKKETPPLSWHWNPLKPGEVDTFTCPLFVPGPEDPDKVPAYCKSQVYVEDQEYQLEEIRARIYLSKYEQGKETKENSHTKTEELSSKCQPYLYNPEVSLNAQSITVNTRAAVDIVKEMWWSPTVDRAQSLQKENQKLLKAPETFPVYSDRSFPDFKGNSVLLEQENAGQFQGTSRKSVVFRQGLSERKALQEQVLEGGGGARNKLFVGMDVENEEFSHKLDGPSHSNAPGICSTQGMGENDILRSQLFCGMDVGSNEEQKQKIHIPQHSTVFSSQMAPVDWVDSDFTCNTKVFNNFPFLASTPNMKTKTLDDNQNNKCDVINRAGNAKNGQDLSVVQETSKERGSTVSSSVLATTIENKPVSDVETHLQTLKIDEDIDPFSNELHTMFLNQANFPHNLLPKFQETFHVINSPLPSFNKSVKLGSRVMSVSGDTIKGAYAKVLKVSSENKHFALKVEKPPCFWEYYICKEIQFRLKPEEAIFFMNINNAYIFKTGSIFEMEWARYGTLLNVINNHKMLTGKMLEKEVSIFFIIELISIIDFLHTRCKIIHADIKPDNFLVCSLPSLETDTPCLKLTDFGRSIDMTIMPPGSKFTQVVTTDGFTCNEMKERRPWTYQIDLYGLAGTIYCVIVGDYMKVKNVKNVWVLEKSLRRAFDKPVWDPIFHQLLNIGSCDSMPDLKPIIIFLKNKLGATDSFLLSNSFKSLENKLNGK